MKLTKALQPLNLADTCTIELTPSFTVQICEAARHNQTYHARVAALALKQPKHPIGDGKSTFWIDCLQGKLTPDTLTYLVEVIIAGWTLTDDDGEPVEFTPANAIEVFNTDQVGRVLASKLLTAAFSPANFEVPLKN